MQNETLLQYVYDCITTEKPLSKYVLFLQIISLMVMAVAGGLYVRGSTALFICWLLLNSIAIITGVWNVFKNQTHLKRQMLYAFHYGAILMLYFVLLIYWCFHSEWVIILSFSNLFIAVIVSFFKTHRLKRYVSVNDIYYQKKIEKILKNNLKLHQQVKPHGIPLILQFAAILLYFYFVIFYEMPWNSISLILLCFPIQILEISAFSIALLKIYVIKKHADFH